MLIENDMRVEDTEKFQKDLTEKVAFEIISLKQMKYDYVVQQ
jgi:hypothetical protein